MIPILHTFVVNVRNQPGVLTRVASLFRRRLLNIDALSVGRTDDPNISRMWINVEIDESQAVGIVHNLLKLYDVIGVEVSAERPL